MWEVLIGVEILWLIRLQAQFYKRKNPVLGNNISWEEDCVN